MKVKSSSRSNHKVQYDKLIKFRILYCPICKRQTLMVRTSLELLDFHVTEDKQCDWRWEYPYWFCPSCSKYFEGHTDSYGKEFWLQFVPPSWDGHSIFNPNDLTDEEYKQSFVEALKK